MNISKTNFVRILKGLSEKLILQANVKYLLLQNRWPQGTRFIGNC